MGFLDKSKNLFSRGGEETIRMVSEDTSPEEETKTPKPAKEPKQPKAKIGRSRLGELMPKAKDKSEETDDALDIQSLEIPEDNKPLPTAYQVATDTAFDLDEDEPNFYSQQQERWEEQNPLLDAFEEETPSKRDKKEPAEYDENKIKDVLDVLKIPATFTISDDTLMTEDFPKIDFDLQVPQGYDIGQVEFFIERAEASISEYLRLLELRNEHVAKLATTVDRLQVDLQNLKYDSQIAAGIGIMPTSDNDELEAVNMELRLENKRLKDQLKEKTEAPILSSKERERYETMVNQFSIINREKEDLAQEILDLKTKLAHLEEEADDPLWMAGSQVSAQTAGAFAGIEYMDEAPRAEADEALPSFDFDSADDEAGELPELDMSELSLGSGNTPTSMFSSEEEDVLPDPFGDEQTSSLPIIEQANSDDDDDDELNKLMKGWN